MVVEEQADKSLAVVEPDAKSSLLALGFEITCCGSATFARRVSVDLRVCLSLPHHDARSPPLVPSDASFRLQSTAQTYKYPSVYTPHFMEADQVIHDVEAEDEDRQVRMSCVNVLRSSLIPYE